MAISLPLLIAYSLILSIVLMWLNRRGLGAGRAMVGTIAACIAIALIQWFAIGPATLSRRMLSHWLVFVCVPAVVVFAASRLSLLQTRPAWLVFLGPLLFLATVVVVAIGYNVVFASTARE
jgi:hypothetical protein